MRFSYLGSGSKGNAALIQSGDTIVMLDCGLSIGETEKRLAARGIGPRDLAGIVVTHEHGDHIDGVAPLVKRYQLPVWMTRGTYAAWGARKHVQPHFVSPHEAFRIGALEVRPYPVPHDAREPCQHVFSDGSRRVGILSDAGSVTPYMRQSLSGCDALLLEFNHDPEMLAQGPYTTKLKKRVAGPWGHLNNQQAAELLGAIDISRLQHLVIAHISQVNNTPALARAAAINALSSDPEWLCVAHQEEGLAWKEIA